jgi:Holliday junction resolvase RusA-like endonuclease
MDLDNLLKRLQDALNQTVLRSAPGKDGAVVSLIARKRPATDGEPIGVRLVIRDTEAKPGIEWKRADASSELHG